jgi:hypothetical protein
VGVINMRSGKLHLRPLVPRFKDAGGGAMVAESVVYASTWSVSMGGKKLTPIEHNAGGASHDQLRNFVAQAESIGEEDKNKFAGFALTKRAGTEIDAHRLSLRSGTLNKKFMTHGKANALTGWTLPTDWAELIKNTLETFLPE